jgi:4'-phosphopantetheinyl transferase
VLAPAEVHVWRASLDPPPAELARLAATLTDDERAVAERRVFAHDRRRVLASRGLLRAVLAGYLGCAPAAVPIVGGPYGKPGLAHGALEMNVAHAAELVLVAVARGRPVGVDVEAVDRRVGVDAVAGFAFGPEERAALAAVPAAERPIGLLELWTRKEAYLKARGDGLSADLTAFEVSLGPAPRLRPIGDAADAEGWTLQPLDVAPGFVAALCVRGRAAVTVRLRDWPGG